jgi:hypothetical protein
MTTKRKTEGPSKSKWQCPEGFRLERGARRWLVWLVGGPIVASYRTKGEAMAEASDWPFTHAGAIEREEARRTERAEERRQRAFIAKNEAFANKVSPAQRPFFLLLTVERIACKALRCEASDLYAWISQGEDVDIEALYKRYDNREAPHSLDTKEDEVFYLLVLLGKLHRRMLRRVQPELPFAKAS